MNQGIQTCETVCMLLMTLCFPDTTTWNKFSWTYQLIEHTCIRFQIKKVYSFTKLVRHNRGHNTSFDTRTFVCELEIADKLSLGIMKVTLLTIWFVVLMCVLMFISVTYQISCSAFI